MTRLGERTQQRQQGLRRRDARRTGGPVVRAARRRFVLRADRPARAGARQRPRRPHARTSDRAPRRRRLRRHVALARAGGHAAGRRRQRQGAARAPPRARRNAGTRSSAPRRWPPPAFHARRRWWSSAKDGPPRRRSPSRSPARSRRPISRPACGSPSTTMATATRRRRSPATCSARCMASKEFPSAGCSASSCAASCWKPPTTSRRFPTGRSASSCPTATNPCIGSAVIPARRQRPPLRHADDRSPRPSRADRCRHRRDDRVLYARARHDGCDVRGRTSRACVRRPQDQPAPRGPRVRTLRAPAHARLRRCMLDYLGAARRGDGARARVRRDDRGGSGAAHRGDGPDRVVLLPRSRRQPDRGVVTTDSVAVVA